MERIYMFFVIGTLIGLLATASSPAVLLVVVCGIAIAIANTRIGKRA